MQPNKYGLGPVEVVHKWRPLFSGGWGGSKIEKKIRGPRAEPKGLDKSKKGKLKILRKTGDVIYERPLGHLSLACIVHAYQGSKTEKGVNEQGTVHLDSLI